VDREGDVVNIVVTVPPDRIANMMVSFVESGDPVSHATKGGWCVSVENKSRNGGDLWYADPKYFMGRFKFEVIERTGHETKHTVTADVVERGLARMAAKFPEQFGQVLADDTDAPCADIFMQCCLFGEEKYA
jgi:hypothetical protein